MNGWIAVASHSFAYIALLSIEKAEPVSMSVSAMRTPAIAADANTCAAPLPAEATALEVEHLVFAFSFV